MNMNMNGMNMNGMNMGSSSTTTSLAGLTKPIMWHSSRIAACTMTLEQCAWKSAKWRNWYRADLDYAHAMVIFMCVTIVFFAGIQLLSRISNTRIRRSHFGKRMLGSYRYISYRPWYLRAFYWYLPSLGIILIGVLGFVFSITLLLAVKPYHRPNTKGPHAISFGSSPPIATRAGWMSLALLPFIMALSAKQNLITLLTGVSHEKLQIFHQWASYAILILALAHTFPFIVHHIWLGDMMIRYYEFFELSHFVAAPLFLVFLFLHCSFRLTSWDYFIATVCVYATSLLVSWVRNLSNGMHTATVEMLNGGGPYGGLPGSFKEFNSILVLIGGSGGSVVVPMLEHFIASNAVKGRLRTGVFVRGLWVMQLVKDKINKEQRTWRNAGRKSDKGAGNHINCSYHCTRK
ncbi:hypothetical protein BZA77DRAFT_374194 [Pyronema omphalodes]|nr:hypothetical protein BZA77DRAFT_374194 [Pyronema omphalodes]